MRWGVTVLTVALLIALVWVSGCTTSFGTTKMDFGNTAEGRQALACFCQTYGDPFAYNGPPRFLAPLVTTALKDDIPVDKVIKLSTYDNSLYFWVIYQNFQQGDELRISWIFQDKVVKTITKKADTNTGFAFGEFVRPDAGWPVGTHTIKIEGKGTNAQTKFDFINGPTERIVFNFADPNGVSCRELLSYVPVTAPVGANVTAAAPVVQTCPQGGTYCTGPNAAYCADLKTSIINCGKCGYACPEGQYCSNGKCAPADTVTCEKGLTNCKGYCSNLANDITNCGSCGRVCPQGQICANGQCVNAKSEQWISGSMSSGTLSCANNSGITFYGSSGNVTDGTQIRFEIFNIPTSNVQDLPAGGMPIGQATVTFGEWKFDWNGYVPGGYQLKDGRDYLVKALLSDTNYLKFSILYQCPPQSCPSNQSRCNDICTSLLTDNSNCGSCGRVCPQGQTCQNGQCTAFCPTGQLSCNGVCTDLNQNSNNCGSCGRVCSQGQTCQSGQCTVLCPSNQTSCNGVCRSLLTDNSNCGYCGRVCPQGQTCQNGQCSVITSVVAKVASCPTGQKDCGSGCVNILSDYLNCGDCGKLCSPGSGTCCNGQCLNTWTDTSNCGSCGHLCLQGQTCQNGQCVQTCASGTTSCSGICVNTQTDSNNCGYCGNKCSSIQYCSNGVCTATGGGIVKKTALAVSTTTPPAFRRI